MGIGNLEGVLRAYSGRVDGAIDDVVDEEELEYAQVYFDSSPTNHRDVWERLASFGDDSQTYYWRVLAAREIMRLYREDPAALDRLAELHGRGPSAELVLHPPGGTPRLDDVEAELARGRLSRLPNDPGRLHFRVEDRAEPAALGPAALALLRYLAQEVYELGGEETPLIVAAAAYPEAPGLPHSSLHATGYAFDVRRRYGSGAQAAAFQWTLERLRALGLIAWSRDLDRIHVTVSPKAAVRTS
jgi:hypothetical protein